MGWLFRREPLRHETPVEHFTRAFTYENDTARSAVVAAAARGRTVYAAIHHLDKQTGASYVYCAVILFKNSQRDGFGYKAMDESMGPYEAACPDHIMRLLSPVAEIPNAGYAADWRARVAAAKTNAANSRTIVSNLKVGDRLKLPVPAHFDKSDLTTDLFTLIRFDKRTPIFAAVTRPTFICRLHKNTLTGATISRA